MTCRCTANNLGTFIRSISQVEVNSVTRYGVPMHRTRTFAPFRSRPCQSRTFSDTTALRKDQTFADRDATSSPIAEDEAHGQADTDSAFVDFSPDAIDALAAEVQEVPQEPARGYETPSKSLLRDLPRRKERAPMNEASTTTIRRTKVENTSFTLHYSNPIRPASEARSSGEGYSRPAFKDSASLEGIRKPLPAEKWDDRRENWMREKEVRDKKYPDGWNPLKKLSPDAISGIRALHAQMPLQYTTEALAQEFEVSPEAIRRILRSKWTPNSDEETERQKRWFKRGEAVWSRYAELGMKPPKKWRELGIGKGKPEWLRKKQDPKPEWVPPPLITHARRRDEKYGANAVLRTGMKPGLDSVTDKIL